MAWLLWTVKGCRRQKGDKELIFPVRPGQGETDDVTSFQVLPSWERLGPDWGKGVIHYPAN